MKILIPVKNSKYLPLTLLSVAINARDANVKKVYILDSSDVPAMSDRMVYENVAYLDFLGINVDYVYDRKLSLGDARYQLLRKAFIEIEDVYNALVSSDYVMFLDADVAIDMFCLSPSAITEKLAVAGFIAPVVLNPTNENGYKDYSLDVHDTSKVETTSYDWSLQFKNISHEVNIAKAGTFGTIFKLSSLRKLFDSLPTDEGTLTEHTAFGRLFRNLLPREDMLLTRLLALNSLSKAGFLTPSIRLIHFGETGMQGWNRRSNELLDSLFDRDGVENILQTLLDFTGI